MLPELEGKPADIENTEAVIAKIEARYKKKQNALAVEKREALRPYKAWLEILRKQASTARGS